MGDYSGEHVTCIQLRIRCCEDGVNHTVEFEVCKKSVKNAGGGGDDEAALSPQEENRIDNDERIKDGIDAADAPGCIYHCGYQSDVADALNINIQRDITKIIQENKKENGENIRQQNRYEDYRCGYGRQRLQTHDFDESRKTENEGDDENPCQHQPAKP